ncbi:MAG TPA: DUF4870 domain-containing protein [Streptosporangiaceae bacterium]
MSQNSPEQPGTGWSQYGGQQYGSEQPGAQQYGGQPAGGPPQYGQQDYGSQQPGAQQYAGQQAGYSGPLQGTPVAGYGPQSASDEKTWAMLAYLSTIVVSFLGPLIIYFVKKDESPFVRHHAAQSLNMMITSVISSVVLFILAIVTGAFTHGIGFGLFLLVWFVYGIALLVFLIIATIAANRGEMYRVPGWLCLRMVS